MNNFWKEIQQPIFALAPMEDVTDTVFREIVMGVSDPKKLQVVYTEFTNVDGMNHPYGKIRVGERLIVSNSEKALLKNTGIKLVAQVWGKNPEVFHKIVKEISQDENFSGFDINMGCPVKNVVKNGCCSALIGTPELAKEIVIAAKEATHLPVSVKTRTGLSQHITEEWIPHLLEVDPAAIILHGRTQKMQSNGAANWEQIELAAQLRTLAGKEIPILGNGDVASYQHGVELAQKHQLEGVMIGRGIFSNPWFFASNDADKAKTEKLQMLIRHATLYNEIWGIKKNFNILKRFFKIYTNGFDGASKLRGQLMEAQKLSEVEKIIEEEMAITIAK